MKSQMKFKLNPVPKLYWDDSEWADKNFTEIVKQYPDKYAGIYKKKVVVSGKTIASVRNAAYKKFKIKELPIIFAEKKIYVY